MKRYKIAFLGLKGIPATSGADRVVECLVDQLSGFYDITVYCKKGYANGAKFYKGVNRVFIPTLPIKNLDTFVYFLLSALHSCLIKRYALVHIHNIDCAFILPLLKVAYRSRMLSTSHGSPYEREKWSPLVKRFFRYMEKKFMRYSPAITSVASPLKYYYERKYGKKVTYIPNGVSVTETGSAQSPGAYIESGNERIGEYILFAAGRILPSKGCHIFLEAINKANYSGRVLVVGDLSQMPEYTARLKSMATPGTEFAGFIKSKEELMVLVKGAKIFVFPSTYEAASMMLLEAISQGVPVIVSDIPENKSLLAFPGTLFFKSANPDDLGKKIIWTMENYDQAHKIAGRLKDYVFTEYSWKKIAYAYRHLYDEMINNN